MCNNLISVVITTYNRPDYIRETLCSIENQTYNNIEIIVIDDGSSSEIVSIIKRTCAEFSKCQYYWKPNSGQPDSRNYGIKIGKGDFFAFCDDDDYWVLDKLEKQIAILKNHKDFDIVTGSIGFVDKNSNVLESFKSHEGHNHGKIFENLLIDNRTSSVTPLLRKKVFEKTGLFNPKFRLAEDWDFWRRASFYHNFYAQNEILAYVRIHDSNMSYKDETVYNRVMLYRKLSHELLKWGKNKLNKSDRNLIFFYEKQKYQKIISNNFDTKFKQFVFILQLSIKNPYHGFHIVCLFLKPNIK